MDGTTRTIWKFTLLVTDQQVIEMPRGAQILAVQCQRGEPMLWALVDPNVPMEGRRIRIYGTGHHVNEPGVYIGTFQTRDGGFVFHVFDAIG